ncbi:MAG: beta-lactamase family protein [Alphaproteobacteria bacterium]|nr:beta-lactamase family protein [Alphaproteobacteria bacterium]
MARAESVGFSAKRLELLDKVMKERYVDSGMLPFVQTQIWRKGHLAHFGQAGHADLERGTRIADDTISRIYSMSKPITGVALMMLVEEGKLGLDDDVHTHIPEWKNLGVYASGMPTLLPDTPQQFVTTRPQRRMKVIDLATHTAGLTYGFLMRTAVDAAYRRGTIAEFKTEGGLAQMVDDLSRLPLEFSPGTQWNYSIGMDVIGYLVEKLSGQKFGEFLRTRLFEPLGMNDTAFFVPEDKIARFASCYQPNANGKGIKIQDDAKKTTYGVPPGLESGGGGLVSTIGDYMRFCRMFLGKGTLDGVQILSPKSVQLFSLNHLEGGREMAEMAPPATQFSETGYNGIGFSICCGVNMNVAKTRLPGTTGEFFWGGAASTAFWVDPKEDLAVVFFTQVMGSDARLTLRRDLRTLVYSAMTESFA